MCSADDTFEQHIAVVVKKKLTLLIAILCAQRHLIYYQLLKRFKHMNLIV